MRDEQGANPKSEETPTPRKAPGQGSALSAIVDFARSLPDRLKRPESLLMIMALLASVGAHMPPYIGLGALADYFERQPRPQPSVGPMEVSFDVAGDAVEPSVPQPPPEEPVPADKPEPTKPKPEPTVKIPDPPKVAPPPAVLPPKAEEPKPEEKVAAVQAEPPPPAPERKQSVTQKSEDPSVEPPPDAKFLAEESRVVEEETVAKVTSETRDDPVPQESAPVAAGAEELGEDVEDDERGAEKGGDTDQQARAASSTAAPEPARPSENAVAKPEQAATAAREAVKAAPAEQPTVVHDPLGSFVLAPARPAQEGREGQKAQRAVSGNPAPNLKVSWRAFESTFGEQQLAQDRMPREAKRRGAGREKRWQDFRAAIENYVEGVKPGNQTALNAAADPFAAYLAAFHRNLHMEFAHDFLESLPALGDLGSADLVTKVEIVVNADGTLDRVGVIKSSGNLMYDFGAFNAVQRGGPYPPPPEKIRSPDGRVYMRWALHRNESQCGTWNAEPYILKTAPRSPNDPPDDGVSPFRSPEQKGERPQPATPGSAPRAGEVTGQNSSSLPDEFSTAAASSSTRAM